MRRPNQAPAFRPPLWSGLAQPPAPARKSGTGVEHRDGTPVLRPARDVVAHRDRALLAVGDRPHARGLDATRGQVVAHRVGATVPEPDVVLTGTALVRVAFNGE